MITKFVIDNIFALILFVLMLPLLVFLAVIVKFSSPGPIFFRQDRVGKDKKIFRIYKFRTMKDGTEKKGMGLNTSPTDPRITAVGSFLRKWSLDELPQILNVLKGEMSIAGPRPTVMSQVEKYTERQLRRLEVKPGITGLAQVSGRNSLSWAERIELDIQYIDEWSPMLELTILAKTVFAVFSKEGVYDKQ